jgi:RNA polymerase sigma-70 factor (ECF subfamily)
MDNIAAEIIVKAVGGDMEAFEAIYRATQGFVYAVSLKMAKNSTQADDIAQEVFIAIHRNLSSFSFRSTFKTWVYRVTVNTALNFFRTNKRHTQGAVDFAQVEGAVGESENVAETIDKKEKAQRVHGLLDKLTPEHKMCLILRELNGLSYEEIAEALKVNINTVRSRLKRAREALLVLARKEGVR